MEWGPQSSGAGFFCFHALEDTKQKKITPLDRGPPLHVNRVLIIKFKTNWGKGAQGSQQGLWIVPPLELSYLLLINITLTSPRQFNSKHGQFL